MSRQYTRITHNQHEEAVHASGPLYFLSHLYLAMNDKLLCAASGHAICLRHAMNDSHNNVCQVIIAKATCTDAATQQHAVFKLHCRRACSSLQCSQTCIVPACPTLVALHIIVTAQSCG